MFSPNGVSLTQMKTSDAFVQCDFNENMKRSHRL